MAVLTFVRHKFWDDSGLPLSGGKVYIYSPGTSTAKQSFTDSTGLIPNANPVILDSKGEAGIWSVGMFKINVTTSTDVQVTGYPVDNCGYDITAQSYASAINGATLKPVPASADEVGIWDSVSGLLNKITVGSVLNNTPLTGIPTAPTAAPSTNTTQVATTAFVLANTTPAMPTITATTAANALTISVAPQLLSFRAAPISSGVVTVINAAPSSLVVPSGATLGTIAATAARLVIIELLNAGVAELAIVNLAGGNQLDETNLISTTAITAGATAANVIYSTTARTSVPYRVVGFIDIVEAVAGTWVTAPGTIQGIGGQALAAMGSLGFGQTWQSFTVGTGNQRVFSTTYYNTTGKPIMVTIWQSSYLNAALTYTVNGFTVPWSGAGSVTGITDSVSFIVPPNGSYSANSATGWLELR